MHALLVLRSKLDAYLEAKNKVLFWCLIGEKQLGNLPYVNIERLTGAAAYSTVVGIDVIQPLRNEPKTPPRERVKLEKKDISSLSEELLEQMHEMDKN